MTVGAANPVNIVGAFSVGESRIHLLDVYAAMRHLGVAGFAGRGGILVVANVAGKAADAFVDTHRRAVVAGSNLRAPVICSGDGGGLRLARRVALIAERLALIGTDLHRARTI